MPVKFNIQNALSEFKKLGGATIFPESLKDVLAYMQNDKNLSTKNEVAWLLATAKVESDYSLSRWESDYVCGEAGVPYKDKPCDKAIRYYRSTDGKKNYFDLGTDKNGMPYFGRGLIQLTGKSNYKTYGDIIGVDLIGDGDKALVPKNSYNIASAYFKRRKVYQYANDENFPMARKSVKGSSTGWEKAKKIYDLWIDIFSKPSVNFENTQNIKKKRIINTILYSALGLSVVGLAYGFYRLTREK
jgi:predicted chitinase